MQDVISKHPTLFQRLIRWASAGGGHVPGARAFAAQRSRPCAPFQHGALPALQTDMVLLRRRASPSTTRASCRWQSARYRWICRPLPTMLWHDRTHHWPSAAGSGSRSCRCCAGPGHALSMAARPPGACSGGEDDMRRSGPTGEGSPRIRRPRCCGSRRARVRMTWPRPSGCKAIKHGKPKRRRWRALSSCSFRARPWGRCEGLRHVARAGRPAKDGLRGPARRPDRRGLRKLSFFRLGMRGTISSIRAGAEVGGALEGRFPRSARSVAVRIPGTPDSAWTKSWRGAHAQGKSSRASGWRGAERRLRDAARWPAASSGERSEVGIGPLRKGNDSPSASRVPCGCSANGGFPRPRRDSGAAPQRLHLEPCLPG